MMLDRIFEVNNPGVNIPGDFGVRLTSKNIEEHLKRIRDDQRLYRKTHTEELRDLEKFVVEKTGSFITESKDYVLPKPEKQQGLKTHP